MSFVVGYSTTLDNSNIEKYCVWSSIDEVVRAVHSGRGGKSGTQ